MPRVRTSPRHHYPQQSYLYNFGRMDEDEVSVVDVYDLASDIGKECEKIIDLYGADAVTALMPKVIGALEMLETLATRNERENTQLAEMKMRIAQLENEKLEKAEYRIKFEKELETIEEQWRAETKELLTLVTKLQEENRRLIKDQQPEQQKTATVVPTEGNEMDVLEKLKDTIEKQRDELRGKEKVLQEKAGDIDNLKTQIERLTNSSRELRRKHKNFQAQVRHLCDERADFLVQLQDQQRNIVGLRQRLGLAQKENEDLAKSDADDPNKPRFTTFELKEILHERNELKAKVNELEDELESYRPKPKLETFKRIVTKDDSLPTEDEAPVQGPLPYEPDDAPWKKCTESGIRKFFRKLFSESNGGASFPRRSLSSLSKMALSSTNDPLPV